MKKTKALHFSVIITLLFSFGCAQVVAPTGGAKDTQAPEVVKVDPQKGTINFGQDQEIRITFDEFVKLDQINEKLIVSPPIKYPIETKLRGKTLQLSFKDTLKENATYVLNFNESIVDITENNPLTYTYVFSTGQHVDSFSVSGRLVYADDLKVVEGAWVGLYEELENDSLPLKVLPTYVDKTDENGLFTISYLKAGTYKIIALADENRNLLFDKPTEKIAFIDEPIRVNESNQSDSLKLFLFQENRGKLYVEEAKENNVNLDIQFSKTVEDLNYSLIDTNIKDVLIKSYLNEGNDSLSLWFNNIGPQRFRLALKGVNYNDTVKFDLDSLSAKSKVKLSTPLPATQPFFAPLELNFNRPIDRIDKSKVQLISNDSVSVNFSINPHNNVGLNYSLKANLTQDSTYHLLISPGAFTDIYGLTTDTIQKTLVIDNEASYSFLKVNIESNYKGAKILQLLDSQAKVLRQQKTNEGSVMFEHLKAGNYSLRLILDENNNGKWDTGEYLKKIQAESVWMYNEPIDLRANWDREIKWIIAD